MTTNARIAAINAIADEFLTYTWRDTPPSPGELEERYYRIKAAVEACEGGFDSWSVGRLFGLLEEKAGKEIANLVALAQTAEPEGMREFEVSVAPVSSIKDEKFVVEPQPPDLRELPEKLIAGAVALKIHNQKQGKTKSADQARGQTEAAKNNKEFMKWVESDHVKAAKPKNVNSIKKISGFNPGWAKEHTIKKWWRDAFPGYEFSSGREKKK